MESNNAQNVFKKIEKKGSIYGLESITALMEELSNPERELNVIHVAGTNGKGSVIAFLNTILMQAGYCTGCYTSPAVFAKTESFRVNNEQIAETEYERLLETVLLAAREAEKKGYRHPSAFEIETALAFLFFKEKACDFVLLETGLGGDMDATNVVQQPVCTVFTSISRDHMHLLGNTIEEIAGHKAGIIKENVPVVSANQEQSVEAVLRKQAEEREADFFVRDAYEFVEVDSLGSVAEKEVLEKNCAHGDIPNVNNQNACVQYFKYGKSEVYQIQLLGSHQVENASVALKVVEVLRKKGFVISDEAVGSGLVQTNWRGRFTCLHKNPDIYMDGAHNEAASRMLSETVRNYMGNKRKIMIAGMLADKDYDTVMKNVGVLADVLITITPPVERGLKADVLLENCQKHGIQAVCGENIKTAVAMAKEELKEEDALLIFGSLSFLKEAQECVEELFGC